VRPCESNCLAQLSSMLFENLNKCTKIPHSFLSSCNTSEYYIQESAGTGRPHHLHTECNRAR
jgi:hypothetical protein